MFWIKTIYSKIEKILHRALKVINGIDDFYDNFITQWLYLNPSKVPSILSARDIQKHISSQPRIPVVV